MPISSAMVRTLLHGLFDDGELGRQIERFLSGRLGAALDEPFDTSLQEIRPPAPNRALGNPDLPHDGRDTMTHSVHQDDPRALDDFLRGVSIGRQPVQLSVCFPRESDTKLFVCHPRTESHVQPWIQMLVTEHWLPLNKWSDEILAAPCFQGLLHLKK